MTTIIILCDITPPAMVESVCPCYGECCDEYHLKKECGCPIYADEKDWCGCLGEEGSGVCDDCDETNYDQELMEEVNVKENPVDPPLMVWDGKEEYVYDPSGKFKIKKEDKCFFEDCYEYGVVEWKAAETFVCRDCAKTIIRNAKKFTKQWE